MYGWVGGGGGVVDNHLGKKLKDKTRCQILKNVSFSDKQ
jgi:hypothetical protein